MALITTYSAFLNNKETTWKLYFWNHDSSLVNIFICSAWGLINKLKCFMCILLSSVFQALISREQDQKR